MKGTPSVEKPGPAQPSREAELLDVLIVGAGPAGLAAAIAAKRSGLSYRVLEKGALVNSLLHYPAQMVFFTTPELMEIGGLPFVSPHDKPSRQEALRYYRRVTDTYELDIAFGERVVRVTPASRDREVCLFDVESETQAGGRRLARARTVVIATGAYDVVNRLDIEGEDLPHVSHYYTEPHPYYRKRVIVVGGKNSAAEAALDLYRSGAQVTLVHRRPALGDSIKYWVKPDIENRIAEGSIPARFDARVVEIRSATVIVESAVGREELAADAVFLLTGYSSDPQLLRGAGIAIDPETGGPVHDAQTYETNVEGIYVIGAAIAGRQSGKIFIENGRFHGEVVIGVIATRLGKMIRSG